MSDKSGPTLVDTGDVIIAASPAPDGGYVEVKDAKSVDELRALIAERHRLGQQITKKLIDRGLHAADSDKTQVVS